MDSLQVGYELNPTSRETNQITEYLISVGSLYNKASYSSYKLIFGCTPRRPFEIELGISLSNPAQHTDHTSLTRRKLQAIRTITRANLETSQERQDKRNTGASVV